MRLQIRGFIVNDYLSNRAEVLDIFTKAIEEGKPDVSAQRAGCTGEICGGNTGKLVTALQH
jgi:NADPH-dependent curcumin reductase CurA